MLVVLLGSGQGLTNGVRVRLPRRRHQQHLGAQRPDERSVSRAAAGAPGAVHQRGLRRRSSDRDREVDHITSRFFIRGNLTVSYRGESSSFNVRCVHPDHQYLEKTIVIEGRYINPTDVAEYRKVAVIGDRVKTQLFRDRPAVGEYIRVNGIPVSGRRRLHRRGGRRGAGGRSTCRSPPRSAPSAAPTAST